MAQILKDIDAFKFLSRDFLESVQDAIDTDQPFYFSSFEFSIAANLLFDAVQQAQGVLGGENSLKEDRQLELAVIWRIEEEEGLPALIKADRNYRVDFSAVMEAVQAEMEAVVFDESPTALAQEHVPYDINALLVGSEASSVAIVGDMLALG